MCNVKGIVVPVSVEGAKVKTRIVIEVDSALVDYAEVMGKLAIAIDKVSDEVVDGTKEDISITIDADVVDLKLGEVKVGNPCR